MQTYDFVVATRPSGSFKVQQIRDMFGLQDEEIAEHFTVELPTDESDWDIGLIVGPSGSGKSQVARQAWPDAMFIGNEWHGCLIENFPGSIKDAIATLTATGLASVPTWLKPYDVCSNGEKFRADLALALTKTDGLLVYDEFTSVVDRTVAKIGSYAVSKAVRKDKKRFVAVSCHYDIAEWLEPDWVLDMGTQILTRGRLRRPPISLRIGRCLPNAWRYFSRHHYLSHGLSHSAQCYMGTVEDRPAVFAAVGSNFGHADSKRVQRLVVHPDFQGVGLATTMVNYVGTRYQGYLSLVTTHPTMIRSLAKNSHWVCVRSGLLKPNSNRTLGGAVVVNSAGRITASFRYRGLSEDIL